jgi:hypothetical protein
MHEIPRERSGLDACMGDNRLKIDGNQATAMSGPLSRREEKKEQAEI